MAHVTIPDTAPRVQYTVLHTPNTQFTIPFPFFNDTDIVVYVDNVLQVLNTDYTVAGDAGTDEGYAGGDVHLTVGVTNCIVTVYRDVPVERTSDFPTNGAFDIVALNTELDSMTAQIQQEEQAHELFLRVPNFDDYGDMTLPAKADRLGVVLGFNEVTGDPQAGPTIADVESLADITADIATLADIEDGTENTDAIQTAAGIAANISTVANISTDVTAVANNNADISTVADDLNEPVSEINTVANSIANVDICGADIANINTTAGDIANVNTVAGSIANVNATGNDIANVNTVATDIANVNTLAAGYRTDTINVNFVIELHKYINEGNTTYQSLFDTTLSDGRRIADMSAGGIVHPNDVGIALEWITNADYSPISQVTTHIDLIEAYLLANGYEWMVSAQVSAIHNVSEMLPDVENVSSNMGSVNTTSSNITDVNTVAGIAANVTTVAGIHGDVSTVSAISTDVSTVAADGTDIGTVAGISADVQALADIEDGTVSTNAISTLAPISANVTTAAGISANITTVAGISTDVTTVSGIASDVSSVSTNNANVTTVANNIADVNTVATNIADVNNAYSNAQAAITARAGAETAETGAVAAQTAAELARDQAYGATNVYPDIASGLSGTVSGDYFSVVGTGNTFITLYKNDSGSEVEQNSLYADDKIDEMEDTQITTAFVQAAAISQIQARLASSIVFPN